MEEIILNALGKRTAKGRPINVSVPKSSEKTDKIEIFDSNYEETPNEVQIAFLIIDKAEKLSSTQTQIEAYDNDNISLCKRLLSDLQIDISKAEELYSHILILNQPITKQYMVNEIIARQININSLLQSVYLLLLLKINEEQTVLKYNEFLIIKNDNLLIWIEVLMETVLMINFISQNSQAPESNNLTLAINAEENNTLISKISEVMNELTEQQDLLCHAQYMIHNLAINEGISLPRSEDPSQEHIVDDSVIVEPCEYS